MASNGQSAVVSTGSSGHVQPQPQLPFSTFSASVITPVVSSDMIAPRVACLGIHINI